MEYAFPAWMILASCRDYPELFFRDDTASNTGRMAKSRAVCAECPVSAECESYALTLMPEHGIWAGSTPSELAALKTTKAKLRE